MKELTEIIRTLNASEVRLIRKLYKLDGHKENKKRLELFNIIKDEGVIESLDACMKLYKHKPDSKFSHLKSRLKDDILNAVIMQPGESKFSAKYKQAEFDCRKLLLEGDMLLSRGAYTASASILKQASKLAEKYHLTVEQIVIQDILRSHLGYKKGIKVYKEYEENIHYQLGLLQDIFKAKEYLYYIGIENTFFKNREHEFKQYAEKSIKELEESYKRTQSPNIGYYYYYIAIFYSEITKDFQKGLEYAIDFLILVENEPSIYTPSRYANANLQIAGMLMKMGQHKQATSYAEKALNSFMKSTVINQLIAMEVLFYSYMYSDQLEHARKTLDRAVNSQAIVASKFNQAKWTYFRANMLFKEGKYVDSMMILRMNSELSKDKTGWSLGWQLLEIMNLIEMQDFEVLYYRLESFKKTLNRNKGGTGALRTMKSVKVLESLMKNNFDFKLVNQIMNKELEELSQEEGELAWTPLSPEVIRFELWFRDRIKIQA